MSFEGKLWRSAASVTGILFFFLVVTGPPLTPAQTASPQVAGNQETDPAQLETKLQQRLRRTPNDPALLARLGTVLAMQNKNEAAIPLLEKALKLNPRDVETRRTLSTTYWQGGQLENARTNLELVLRSRPQDGWATLLLGMISEDLGDHARSAKLLSGILPRVRQRPEPILSLARAYYQLKETDRARATLQYLNELPNNAQAVFAGARTAAEFQDYETAESLFRSVQYTYPNPSEIQLNLALAQYGLKHYDDSQKTLLASIQSGYATANTYELLGWTYEREDKLDDMMKAFEKAINMDPGQPSHFLELGQALLDRRISGTAVEVAAEAVKRFPTSSRAYSLKGAAELATSRLPDALQSYGKAAELDPNDPKAALGLALTYWNASQDAQAATAFRNAAAKFPENALIQLKYAIFLMDQPQEKTPAQEAQIKALLKRAEQLDPSFAEAHFHLGNIAVKEENLPEAMRELTEAEKLDPEMSKVHFALAKVYRRLGKPEEAAKETEIQNQLKAKEDEKSEANLGKATRHQ